MVRIAQLAPTTEGGKRLLQDFLDHKTTGFCPFKEKGIGGVDHWRSRQIYQDVSHSAFRNQSKKTAKIAMAQLTAEESDGDDDESEADDRNSLEEEESEDEDEEQNQYSDDEEDSNDDEESDDERSSSDDASKDSNEHGDVFDNFGWGKLSLETERRNSPRKPFNEVYPMGDRIFLLFELDGDVRDEISNQFEISENGKKVCRWGRVPAARMEAINLIGGVGLATASEFSFLDADCMIVDAAIKKRMGSYKKDEDGEYWELRDEEDLVFPCRPFFYNKLGQQVESYILDRNDRGYAWGYFWLVGRHVGQVTTKSRRMGGKRCDNKAAETMSQPQRTPPVAEVAIRPKKKHKIGRFSA
jgi:hypothetical protein